MELVRGEPLSTLIARGPSPTEETLRIVEEAAWALQAAHERGFVHRDVKPGNILVRTDGMVKLTDFGIAKAADAVPVTRSGMVMGTAHYIAPEQASGGEAGPAGDVYSLGIVGYECLAGHRPFRAESAVAVAMMQVRDQPPPLPATVPAARAGADRGGAGQGPHASATPPAGSSPRPSRPCGTASALPPPGSLTGPFTPSRGRLALTPPPTPQRGRGAHPRALGAASPDACARRHGAPPVPARGHPGGADDTRVAPAARHPPSTPGRLELRAGIRARAARCCSCCSCCSPSPPWSSVPTSSARWARGRHPRA